MFLEMIMALVLVPGETKIQKKQAKMAPGLVVISVKKAQVDTSGWVPKEAILVDTELNVFLKDDAKLEPFPSETACIFCKNTEDGWLIELFSANKWEVSDRIGPNVVVIVGIEYKFLGLPQPKLKAKEDL